MSLPMKEFDIAKPNGYGIACTDDLARYWFEVTKDEIYTTEAFKDWLCEYEHYMFWLNRGNCPRIWDEEVAEYPILDNVDETVAYLMDVEDENAHILADGLRAIVKGVE